MKKAFVPAVLVSAALTAVSACGVLRPRWFGERLPDKWEAQREAAKEDPLFVIVTVDRERRVFVNKERAGTTEDVGPLREELARALERRRQGIREGTVKVPPGHDLEAAQRTVYVDAPFSFKYAEIERVVEAIKGVGGSPYAMYPRTPWAKQ